MKFPWANVALLILLVALLVTGYFGFVNGRVAGEWLLWLHGIAAYGVMVLLFWKTSIVFDAYRRKKTWTWPRVAFAFMAGLLLVTLALGLLWTFVGPIYVGGFSLVSLHIYVAVLLLGLVVWHFRRMRFVLRLPETTGRRLFMGTAVSALIGLLFRTAFEWVKSEWQMPGAMRRFTGSYERGSFTQTFPSVSWIADRPPPVDVAAWQLRVDGVVERPFTLTYEQFTSLAGDRLEAVLDCTGGWYTTQWWQGVYLEKLLEMAGMTDEAGSVTIQSVTGYRRRFSIAEVSGLLLSVGVAERPLSHGHGFPLRLVAPDKRGVEWVKWVTKLRVNATSKIWQTPLPLQ